MSAISGVELVMWSPARSQDPPRVTEVVDALTAQGFPADRAQAVPEETAFRRAVGTHERGADPKKGENPLKATFWTNGTLHGQIDELLKEPEHIRRKTIATWRLTDNGACLATSGDLHVQIGPFKEVYTWSDVSKVIQAVLQKDGLGAYTPKKSGGVYFVPVASVDLLDKLENAAGAIGLNFLRFQIPDTAAGRAEVADAIYSNLQSTIDEHAAAIAEYKTDVTRAGVVRNRIDAMAETKKLIKRVASHLQGKGDELTARVDALTEACTKQAEMIDQYRPTQGKRQVLFS